MSSCCRLKKQLQEAAAREAVAAAGKEGGKRIRKAPLALPLAAPTQLPIALASQKSLGPAFGMHMFLPACAFLMLLYLYKFLAVCIYRARFVQAGCFMQAVQTHVERAVPTNEW